MKKTAYLLWFFTVANAFVMIMNGVGITPVPLGPTNVTAWEEAYNTSAVVDSWDPTQHDFYDTGSGLYYFWNINVPVIEAFITFIQAITTETLVIDAIRIIWRPIWLGYALSFLSGRDFMP